MKRIAFLSIAAALMLPCVCFAGKKEKDAEISVISYNIRLGSANDGTNSWAFRYPATAMMLQDQHPDIFGVQEALPEQVNYILSCFDGRRGNISYKSVGVGRDDGKKKGEHMSIFYDSRKIKLLKWGTYWLSETPEKPSRGWDAACYRTATWALMKDKESGKLFYYVNTHLDHKGKEARVKGLALIVERIASMNPENYPMILTGDFNVGPDNPCLKSLEGKMLSARESAASSDSKPSFNGWGKKYTVLDYIYYSGFSDCSEFLTVDKPYMDRKFISDHYPIKAVLKF